ncbi:YcaO-like family protein [Belnapia rosea]|uniref:Ribosomal protein S12 methylthiotransferase accessory factor n=1 Tax=Belnapia rosea TaxID=938405 RepID=A0A1G6UI47_9PROT|nr:YcaO-like family protein [Belnapia rosea]SDD40924.1 ribosomal protein S12 methylthiotransferase accessory factor [Belnapia rosea]
MNTTTDLHEVARAFRASMPEEGHVTVFRIDMLDRIGIPVVQANLIVAKEPATTGYGYGFEAIEAEVGALGELCEEVHVGAWLKRAPRLHGSRAALVRERGETGVVDPLTLCLPAGSPYTPEMPLSWVEARRWSTGEPVLVPCDWVAAYPYQLGETPRLITPITNGLGAGFDLPHAISHGLMELLQRDGNAVTYRALDQGVVVEVDTQDEPEVAGLLEHLRSLGIDVIVKLACTDFGIPNLYVVGNDRGAPTVPVQVTSCGEASHPDRSRTLRKALLEFCGSRSRKAATHGPIDLVRAALPRDYVDRQIGVAMLEEEEGRALQAMAEWVGQDAGELRRRLAGSVFSDRRRVRLSELPTVPAPAVAESGARLRLLTERFAAEGLEPLVIDCSPAGSPVKVVKTIVPGLESETMSYHRIGWRGVRRLRGRGDPLLLDAARDGAQRVRLRPEDEARAGGPAWFDARLADETVGRLYPLYRECGTFSAQLYRRRQAA